MFQEKVVFRENDRKMTRQKLDKKMRGLSLTSMCNIRNKLISELMGKFSEINKMKLMKVDIQDGNEQNIMQGNFSFSAVICYTKIECFHHNSEVTTPKKIVNSRQPSRRGTNRPRLLSYQTHTTRELKTGRRWALLSDRSGE